MRLLKYIFTFTIVSYIAFSCTEPIDLKLKNDNPRLSIYGYITNQKVQHEIRITRTTGFFDNNPPMGISNAIVTITDGINTYPFTEVPDSAGIYRTNTDVFGLEGMSYALDIELDFDQNGQTEHYQAKSTMPYATRLDSVLLGPFMILEQVIPCLYLYGKVPEIQKNSMGIYVSKNLEEKSIFDSYLGEIYTEMYFKGYDIHGYPMPYMVRDSIVKGDTIDFKVCNLNEEFANFIREVNTESSPSIPLFSGPPANVKTNITALDINNKTKIIGFFSTITSDEKRIFANEDYIFRNH